MTRRVVAALGGNALLGAGSRRRPGTQERNVMHAAAALAEVASGRELVVTHGNGPQIGLLALQSAALEGVGPTPLDVLGAESEGMVGYLLARELRTPVGRPRVRDAADPDRGRPGRPGLRSPSKPIGPPVRGRRRTSAGAGARMVDGDGRRCAASSGGFPRASSGGGDRVGSHVARRRNVVVCAGGGGVPVCVGEGGCGESKRSSTRI